VSTSFSPRNANRCLTFPFFYEFQTSLLRRLQTKKAQLSSLNLGLWSPRMSCRLSPFSLSKKTQANLPPTTPELRWTTPPFSFFFRSLPSTSAENRQRVYSMTSLPLPLQQSPRSSFFFPIKTRLFSPLFSGLPSRSTFWLLFPSFSPRWRSSQAEMSFSSELQRISASFPFAKGDRGSFTSS